MKKQTKRIIALLMTAVIIMSLFVGFSADAETVLLKQYTFQNGMPEDFTPASFDGVVKAPKVVYDAERGSVLRQYFGAGTGYGNGDPQGESYVDINPNPYKNTNTANGVTLMLWVKTEDNAPWDYNDTILSFNNATTRFALNNAPYFNYNENGTDRNFNITASQQQSLKGTWLHYAFTIGADGLTMFVNGEEIASNESGNIQRDVAFAEILDFIKASDTTLNLGLGGYFGSQDCYMDDIRFYIGIMPDEEIYNIYDETVDYVTRNAKTVAHSGVHDPSIVACYTLADGTQVGENDPRSANAVSKRWWIFGSHLAAGYSDDLINWYNYASGFDGNNPLMNGTDSQGNTVSYTDTLTYDLGYHGDITGMWAGCVIWNENLNKWCMYGSCTSVLPDYGYNSVLWVTYSDRIEGPYTDAHPMVFTNPSFNVSNSQNYIASVCPAGADYQNKCWWNNTWRTTHTVDPTTFFDKDGNLWMIYGSYNSIFILPMDENTGLPDYQESYQRELAATNAGKNHYDNNDWYSDWYWGTRINYTNFATDFTGEGTFVYYDEDTDYYYFYITYGGFAALGGYNLRVYRSRNPEGPYTDAVGTDIVSVLDSDSTPVNGGVKMTANYQWSCNSVAYMSPGHDSVIRENIDGVDKLFQMYHVRFNNYSEGFFDQIHQMVMTKDGWTIMLPYEYYGETVDYNHEYSAQEIAGAYEFIDLKDTTYHIKDESDYDRGSDIVVPTQRIVLSQDGKIYGAATYIGGTTTDYENAHNVQTKGIIGTWSEDSGSCYADFNINGIHYSGVFTYQYDESKMRNRKLVFAATGDNYTIWGSKISASSYSETDETNSDLLKQVKIDGGVISDESARLYGNAAVVNDDAYGTVLFVPDGNEGWATIDNPYFGKELDEVTISFRYKVTEQSAYDGINIIMSFINSASEWGYFTLNAGPQAHIFSNGYADFYYDAPPEYTYNDWHNYTFTVDSDNNVNIYVDGVSVGYVTNTSQDYDSSVCNILDWLSSTESIYFGKTQQPSGADWSWNGQECYLDNICFYDSILAERQIVNGIFDGGTHFAKESADDLDEISVDPVVYTHGNGDIMPYMYYGNTISDGREGDDRITHIYIPDEYRLVSLTSDNGSVSWGKDSKGYYLKGTVSRNNSDMALTLYLKNGNDVYKKTVYTYVMPHNIDAHVAEWNCIKGKNRSLCHISRLMGSEGSGGNGNFAYLENPTAFYDASDSASGMGIVNDGAVQNAGAYAYSYTTFSINRSITNSTVPNAVYYIDKSNSEYWDGSQYRFTWRFTTLNGNSSALWSTGRNVYGESSDAAVSVDVSAGVYDDSPNNGGVTRDYYVTGSTGVQNNTVTVSMTQGSSPKASVNHKINLTVNLFDKSTLRNALKSYESVYEGEYSSTSWKRFENAKRQAYAYLNNYKNTDDSAATQQSYISALDDAYNALEVVDYTRLENLVSTARSLDREDYTDSTFTPLDKAVRKYEKLIGCAPAQSEVNKAADLIDGLMNDLVRLYEVAFTVLDTVGNPIESASVVFNGDTVLTDEYGAAVFRAEEGSYTLAITGETLLERNESINVTDDMLSNVDVVNCDVCHDGIINAKDLAAAQTLQNTAAQNEFNTSFDDIINKNKDTVQYSYTP